MAYTMLDPGGDQYQQQPAGAGGFWRINGTASQDATDFVHGIHTHSIRHQPAVGSAMQLGNVFSDAGCRMNYWAYFVAAPTSAKTSITKMLTTGAGSSIFRLYMTSGRVLQLWRGAGTAQIGSNGSTLSLSTWYRITITAVITSATVWEVRVYVNGVLDISASNVTSITTGLNTVRLGNDDTDATLDFRTSDILIETTAGVITDTGDITIIPKRPFASGSSSQFTTQIGSGGSGYGTGHAPQVNEIPSSQTNGWSRSNTTIQTENYSMESAGAGVDLANWAILGYMGWVMAQVDSTSNSPVHRIIVNGVSTAITLTTGANSYLADAGTTTYPTGNQAIGISAQYTTTPHRTSLFECGMVFACVPAPMKDRSYKVMQATKRAAVY